MVFFTGGSGIIQPYLYRDFLHHIENNGIRVFVPRFRENITEFLYQIDDEYTDVTYVAHSSGATVALNNCNGIKKLVLMDPVNTRLDDTKYDITNMNQIIFLNALKSFRITYDPYGLPFVPFLRITPERLLTNANCAIEMIEYANHGHCDILNQPYSDLMHYTRIAVGVKDRQIQRYQKRLADDIGEFINLGI